MKKTTLAAALFAVFASFISCGTKAELDASGFYLDIDEAKAAAADSNKNLLVFITEEGEDENSASFMKKMRDKTVKKAISEKNVLVVMDFTKASYEKTVVKENASKADKEKAEKLSNIMQKSSRFAAFINPEIRPAVYLMSKEGYYASHLPLKGTEDAADFITVLGSEEYKVKALNEMVLKTKKGTNVEKVNAINEIFDATEPNYRMFIVDLLEEAITLDPKNESGLLDKFVITTTEYRAASCYISGDVDGMVKIYANAGENQYLSADERQQAYYMAGYSLVQAKGPEAIDLIIEYMQKSYDANPTSEAAPELKKNLDYFKDFKVKAEQEAAQTE